MKNLTFDNESKIIENFQKTVENSMVYFPHETKAALQAFSSIHDENNWAKWSNSSGKNDPPPDFFSNELGFMMEVMRVDDHAYVNSKGKLVNPTLSRETQMRKELADSGILELFPNLQNITTIADTHLPTTQDHNYTFYKENFTRTVKNHAKKIDLYRRNHPELKLIFFVMDESSAYSQSDDSSIIESEHYEGEVSLVSLHCFWSDRAFLESFLNSDVDFLVWYTPYKLLRSVEIVKKRLEIVDLPRVCVYDIKEAKYDTITYNEKLMLSSEI
jgi:hypothetical protein